MDHYCLFGNPVAHSKSPQIHGRFAELTGQTMVYDKTLVPLGEWAQALAGFIAAGGKGCNITVPFKTDAFASATQRSERAELAQACNMLRFENGQIHADNTDGQGLVNDIRDNAGVPIAGARVLLIGAGGASSGALGPLILAGAREIVLSNRTLPKAQALVQRHAALAARAGCALHSLPLDAPGEGFDIVINATSTSMAGAAVPVPDSVLRAGTLAYDMMYGPAAAPFAEWARQHGAVPCDGLGMLIEQAAEAFAQWRGVRPPTRQVLDEMRAALKAA